MKRSRFTSDLQIINEGVYDFYEVFDTSRVDTKDKIINYYIDKIRKSGLDSLTAEERQIFDDARKGKLTTLEKPIYKRNKLTGDIELDANGNAIRLDKEVPPPGVPFITSKGKGDKKKETIEARIYWDREEPHRTYYVYGGTISNENPMGLIMWKTVSSTGKEFGAFIIPKNEANLRPDELWKNLNNKYEMGLILDKETAKLFLEFDKLYHESRKQNYDRLIELCRYLRNYTGKK